MFEILKRTLTRRGRMENPRSDRLVSVPRRFPTAIGGLLAVAAVFGASPDAREYDNEDTTESHASSTGTALDELLAQECYACEVCDEGNGHEILNQTDPPPGEGVAAYHDHPCLAGSGGCFGERDPHPRCNGPQFAFSQGSDDVINSLIASTPVQLATLLERYPHRLRINQSRKALQLIGCRNQVVASYSATSIPALAALFAT